MEAFNYVIVKNDGEKDGKCIFDGKFGSFLNDLLVNNWLKLGHK